MARSRNIKPTFFKDEGLVELPFEYRILLLGLNALADREGRLLDRPKVIKMEVFPADDVNVDEGLWCLYRTGRVLRYVVDNKRYIQVIDFLVDQNPHINEKPSEVPPPPALEDSDTSTVQLRLIPDSSFLIPDSPFLIPDSPEETPGEKNSNAEPAAPNGSNGGGPPKIASSVEVEVAAWMTAIAPLLGAKSADTIAQRSRWLAACTSLVREQRDLAVLMRVVTDELRENERYFTPERCVEMVQRSAKTAASVLGDVGPNGQINSVNPKTGRRWGEASR